LGIYKKLFQKGKSIVQGQMNKQPAQLYKPPPPKKDYTPLIIGAIGVLVIGSVIINNKNKK
jgi:hypothetical protein